jgi:hypothetical protein
MFAVATLVMVPAFISNAAALAPAATRTETGRMTGTLAAADMTTREPPLGAGPESAIVQLETIPGVKVVAPQFRPVTVTPPGAPIARTRLLLPPFKVAVKVTF